MPCDCSVCTPAELKRRCIGPDRSFVMSFVPLVLTLCMWPLFGVYKRYVFPESYPYPMTIAFVTQAVVFVIGSLFYASQCFTRGFRLTDGGKTSKKKKGKKNPVTIMICVKRLFHWGFFPGLFLDVFLFASFCGNDLCPHNPNLCSFFFRAALFLFALLFLAIAKAGRRGGRLDWFVGLILLVGVTLLLWNNSLMFKISDEADLEVIIAGALIMVSFGAFPMMLRKSTLISGIKKVMWVMSFYSMAGLIPLMLFFEGLTPWTSLNITLGWKLLILVIGCVLWSWSVVAAVAYSETICVALALHLGLVLGDIGVYNYILTGYTFQWTTGIGLILVAIGFLWLLKRMVTLGFHKDMTLNQQKEEIQDVELELGDVDLEPENPLFSPKGKAKNEKSKLKNSKLSSYGSVPSPPKPKKKASSRSTSFSEEASASGSFSESSGKKKKRLSGFFKKKDKKSKYQGL